MKKIFIIIGFLLLAIAVYFYVLLFGSNTGDFTDKTFLFIPTGSTYADLLKNVEENHVVKNIHSFDQMATRIGLSSSVHPGKYQIKQGMGNFTIVQMLKGGKQIPVKLVINKLRTKDDIVRKICDAGYLPILLEYEFKKGHGKNCEELFKILDKRPQGQSNEVEFKLASNYDIVFDCGRRDQYGGR
jgi:cell division protein YceG involved in septum cleavage